MRSPLILSAIALFAFQATAQGIAAAEPYIPSNWKAFATGSYVTDEHVRKMPGKPESKSQIKTVLKQSEHSAFTRFRGEDGFTKAEPGSAGEGTPPEEVGFKKVDSHEEKITVAGKEYRATVTMLSMTVIDFKAIKKPD